MKSDMPVLGVYNLDGDVEQDVILPEKGTEDSACLDIRSFLSHVSTVKGYDKGNNKLEKGIEADDEGFRWFFIHPGERILVPTGMIFDIPKGFSIRAHPRSSIPYKSGTTLANCEAVVDSDYINETYVMLHNQSEVSVVIEDFEKIAQIELYQEQPFEMVIMEQPPEQKTDRVGGTGSTGKK